MFFEMGTRSRHGIGLALWSGLRRKCPRCHRGSLFSQRYDLRERCAECDYRLSTSLDEVVILTYVGSASITGLFLLAVFVVRMPADAFEMLVYLVVALGLLFGTLQQRKGFAIALVYVHNLLAGGEVEGIETGDGNADER